MNSKNEISEKTLNPKKINLINETKTSLQNGKTDKLSKQIVQKQNINVINEKQDKSYGIAKDQTSSVVDQISGKPKAKNEKSNSSQIDLKKDVETKQKNVDNPSLKNINEQTFSKKKNEWPDEVQGNANMTSTQLQTLFVDGLKDIYWAEKALTQFIPKLIKETTSEALAHALSDHLKETKNQIITLEQVFDLIGQKATAIKCEAMEGLMREATNTIESYEEGSMRDIAILSVSHKIEHYEIASYNALRYFAEKLEIPEADVLLDDILNEEVSADRKLFELTSVLIKIEESELVETE